MGDIRDGIMLDRGAVSKWMRRNCSGVRGGPVTDPREFPDLFTEIYESLPNSLLEEWRGCLQDAAVSPPKKSGDVQGVRCVLLGSYDVTGENEFVEFEATSISDVPLDLSTVLRRDLEVEGADCGEELWRRGTRINARGKILRCRRVGRSAVAFRLEAKGSCEVHLPELTERPWRELCATGESSEPGSAPAPP